MAPVVREAFPHRVLLVTTARLRDSQLAELADEDDLDTLVEIEGAIHRRLTAESHGIAGYPPTNSCMALPMPALSTRASPTPSRGR